MSNFWMALNGKHYGAQKQRTPNEILLICNARKWRLLTNNEHDARLQKTVPGKIKGTSYDAWTGTYGTYAAPGEKLGAEVTYHYDRSLELSFHPDWQRIFPVPREYRNEKDAILIVEHGFVDKLLFTAQAKSHDEMNSLFNRVVFGGKGSGHFLAPEEYNWLMHGDFIGIVRLFHKRFHEGKPIPSKEELGELLKRKGAYEKDNYLFAKLGASVYVYERNAKPLIEVFDDRKNNIEFVQIADPSKIHLVRNFPAEDGVYKIERKFGVPVGKAVPEKTPGARQLFRNPGAFSGFFRRGAAAHDGIIEFGGSYGIPKDIGAGVNQSHEAGALVQKVK